MIMNGTLDLSNGKHSNAHEYRHDDEHYPMEEWDYSCSDSASSCSSCSTCCTCSTCSSSCSVCDLCDFDDLQNARDDLGSHNSSCKQPNPRESSLAAKHTTKSFDQLDDESGIFTYSSGSDKETNLTLSASSKAGASQSTTNKCKSQRHAKKRVTFSELSGDDSSSAMKNNDVRHRTNNQSAVNIDVEYKRLDNILTYIDPYKLHSIMRRQLKKKRLQNIMALGKLLPKERYSGETSHCVRCHKEYSPQFSQKDCFLPHPKHKLTEISLQGNTASISCSVCKKEYWVQKQGDMGNMNLGHCYVGKHTSNPGDVHYRPTGAAQSCEDAGCIEFYV